MDASAACAFAEHACTALRQLRVLNLDGNYLDDTSALALARSLRGQSLGRFALTPDTNALDHDRSINPDNLLTEVGLQKIAQEQGSGSVVLCLSVCTKWLQAHEGAGKRLRVAAPENVKLEFGLWCC